MAEISKHFDHGHGTPLQLVASSSSNHTPHLPITLRAPIIRALTAVEELFNVSYLSQTGFVLQDNTLPDFLSFTPEFSNSCPQGPQVQTNTVDTAEVNN